MALSLAYSSGEDRGVLLAYDYNTTRLRGVEKEVDCILNVYIKKANLSTCDCVCSKTSVLITYLNFIFLSSQTFLPNGWKVLPRVGNTGRKAHRESH